MLFGGAMQVEEVFLLHWLKLLSLQDSKTIGNLFFNEFMDVGCLVIRPELWRINFRCVCSLSHHDLADLVL
jgi:hypothetical protein